MKPIYRDYLDGLPCACCGEKMHGPMFLHSRCHIESPVIVSVGARFSSTKSPPFDARIMCATCGKTVAVIAINEKPHLVFNVISSKCHPHAKVFAKYENGELKVTCAECEAEVANFHVSSEPVFTGHA